MKDRLAFYNIEIVSGRIENQTREKGYRFGMDGERTSKRTLTVTLLAAW